MSKYEIGMASLKKGGIMKNALYMMRKLHDLIFTISLAAIEVDLPKAVNACINHSWAYNGRRASPYLT